MRKRIVPLVALGGAPAPELPTDPLFLSQEQACKRLGVGKATLKAWIAAGIIYAIPVGRSQLKVPVAEIEKWREGRYKQGVPYGDHGTGQEV